ncbi:MAG TPA: hypothetical protein PKH32_11750, partial [Verrucomicrobiota bacterium]|nr:hypothetical protein [Verrucomicrobiota bacterium]
MIGRIGSADSNAFKFSLPGMLCHSYAVSTGEANAHCYGILLVPLPGTRVESSPAASAPSTP